MDLKVLQEFVEDAKLGLVEKEDIIAKRNELQLEIDSINGEIADVETELRKLEDRSDVSTADIGIEATDGCEALIEIRDRYESLIGFRERISKYYSLLVGFSENQRNFNKSLCFSNIRELLRQNPDVKIGQIEKEAGIRLGYMSRLEKDGNTAEPSVEFIVTAAKLLKVSLDTLVSINLTGLTPTEQYIVNFFDKLKADTLADKLDWNRQTASNLNNIEPNYDGSIWHPLFDEETFFEEGETEYPDQVTRIVFNSKTFGPHTFISGDCFNLRLKNGTTLYLMDIEKSVHKTNDPNAKAIEAWVYVPYKGCQVLVASQDQTPVAPLVVILFETVKNRMEHPQINSDVMYAIDSFMKDDWSDDEEPLPFN